MKTIKLILYHILSKIIPDTDILDVHLDRLRDIWKKLANDNLFQMLKCLLYVEL